MHVAPFLLLLALGPEEAPKKEERPVVKLGDYAIALGGQYRVLFDASNFDFHPQSLSASQPEGSFVGQRLRTWLNFHDGAARRYGVYLQLEVGNFLWSEEFDFPKTVDVELRRGFLWFKPTQQSLLRVGVLDWHDRFGERSAFDDPLWAVDAYDSFRAPLANSVWDFNVGGITFDTELSESWHLGTGAMALGKGDSSLTGEGGALLFTGDLDRESESADFGGSLYYLRDRGGYSYGDFGGPGGFVDSSWDLWAGVRAHLKLGPVRTSLFAILNRGRTYAPDWTHQGWALKSAFDANVASGKLSFQWLYSTGDDGSDPDRSSEFRTIAQSLRDDFGAQSYWSFGGLSSPRGPSDMNDLGVSLQNRGLGLVTLQAAFEKRLATTLTGYVAGVWLRAGAPRPESGSRSMGTELLGELQWRLAAPLGIDVGAAYFWSGDFYRASPVAPPGSDLYQIYARLQLEI